MITAQTEWKRHQEPGGYGIGPRHHYHLGATFYAQMDVRHPDAKLAVERMLKTALAGADPDEEFKPERILWHGQYRHGQVFEFATYFHKEGAKEEWLALTDGERNAAANGGGPWPRTRGLLP